MCAECLNSNFCEFIILFKTFFVSLCLVVTINIYSRNCFHVQKGKAHGNFIQNSFEKIRLILMKITNGSFGEMTAGSK